MPYKMPESGLETLRAHRDILELCFRDMRPDQVGYLDILETYKSLCDAIGDAEIESTTLVSVAKEEAPKTPEKSEPTNTSIIEETPAEEKPAEAATKAEEPAPVQEPKKEKPKKESPKFSTDEVRKTISAARRNGVDIPEILNSLGYSNFTDVPAEKYGELLEAVKNA